MRRQIDVRVGYLLISAFGLLGGDVMPNARARARSTGTTPRRGDTKPDRKPRRTAQERDSSGCARSVMTAHFKGLGYMEQYKYAEAADCFREVRRLAPGWIPGSINLAIALLNPDGREGGANQEVRRRSQPDQQLRRGAGTSRRQ